MTGDRSHKRIFYIVDDYGACGWYRCHVPGMEFIRRGHEVILDDKILPPQAEAADIIVFQRQWRPVALEVMRYAQSRGKLCVYELDDDLWTLHPSNPSYEAWNNPEIIGAAEELMRMADVITTTTPRLAELLRPFNRNIHILPNMLPTEHWDVARVRPEGDDRVAVGWAGSTSRKHDLAVVKDVILNLLDRYPQMDFVIAGDDTNMVFPPHPRIRRLKGVMIEEYPKLLTEFDIGVAPIVDSRFNQAKSDLKFVEYGMVGVPTVASNVEAYVHSIVQGDNGFLAKNDKAWLKYLSRLIEDETLRRQVAFRAKMFAESRTIDKNIGLWEKAYRMEPAGDRG